MKKDTTKKKVICIMSGGMDSTLCAYMMAKEGLEIVGVHFNYAQRTEKKELASFHAICDDLDIANRYVLDIDFLKQLGSALTDTSVDVRTSGVEKDVPATYVPFRNGIFLSMAAALAEKENAEFIAIGVVQDDSSGYPDCTENFIKSIEKSINEGTKESTNLTIRTPLVHLSKAKIVEKSIEYRVPLELTWSCYTNDDKACGECDSCRLRLNGFAQIGEIDPIPYA